jgi:hypothetical protein
LENVEWNSEAAVQAVDLTYTPRAWFILGVKHGGRKYLIYIF